MGGAPRAFTHARRIPPATRYRAEAIVNGGIVSRAHRIARYVEPQTTYTIPSARTTRESRAEAAGGGIGRA